MGQVIAEYLGWRTDGQASIPKIDSTIKQIVPCPFRDSTCVKAQKGQAPVCSLRDSKTNELWIVCEHRLCATSPKDSRLTTYQQMILKMVADVVAPNHLQEVQIAVQRESRVRRTVGKERSDDSRADYLMTFLDNQNLMAHPRYKSIILEMQGGGETSGTQKMTAQVRSWEKSNDPNTNSLTSPLGIGVIETNAWRRQQEQFLFKGSVVTKSNGKLVFAMGARLYDKILGNFSSPPSAIDVSGGWSLALLGFIEDNQGASTEHSIGLSIDPKRTLFTDYHSFSRALTDQGTYDPELFLGKYWTLDGQEVNLS